MARRVVSSGREKLLPGLRIRRWGPDGIYRGSVSQLILVTCKLPCSEFNNLQAQRLQASGTDLLIQTTWGANWLSHKVR